MRIQLSGATVLFSGRGEGDLGRTTAETPPPSSAVRASREALLARCGLRGIAVGAQVHGNAVTVATPQPGYIVDARQADGQATSARGVGVGVHVADCLPIAVAGSDGVVMLHGGWRGLAAGIVAAGVEALRSLGVAGELEAAIGPGARGCCYEVGPEVHTAFARYDAHDGRLLDLGVVAAAQLREAGVGRVENVGLCTLCAPAGMLFSHRRDGPEGGRQGGFAWLG